jgi:iron complex outermembrane receptor protein
MDIVRYIGFYTALFSLWMVSRTPFMKTFLVLPFTPLLMAACINPAVAAVSNEVELAPIEVSGQPLTPAEADHLAARYKSAVLGPLGERTLQDTPYALNVVPRDLIDSQQLKSVKEVYRLIPSVQGDGTRPQTRGFQGSVVQNSRLDGLNIVSTTDYPAEQFDSIQVLNGLAGSLYGPANPAGMFNFISRRPTDVTRNRLTLGMGTGLTRLESADLSGPFDPAGRAKYRLNLLDEQGQGYNPGSRLRRQLVSLAADVQLTDTTVLETNLTQYDYLAKGLPGTFALASGQAFPRAMDPTRRNLGQHYAGNDNTTQTGSLHLKHDFDGNWKLDVGWLRQIADRESTGVTNTLIDSTGDYRSTVATTTASRFTINSYLANLNGSQFTGPVRHDLTVGISGFDWNNYNPVNGSKLDLGSASLSHPAHFARPDYPDFTDRYRSAVSHQDALTLGDTLTFSPRWSLMLTASQSQLSSRSNGKTGQRTSASDDSGLSTAASLLYKPVDDLTLYLTYADSLQQGDTAPAGTDNANTVLPPYRSRMWEAGGKWALAGMNLSLAAFQIKRPYAYTEGTHYGVNAEQRNRGVEFMVDGKATENTRLFGGVTWLDPRLLDTGNVTTDNTQVVGLAKYTASLLADYQVPQLPGVALNATARYVGRRASDNSNDHWVSGYRTFDIGASYTTRLMQRTTVYRLNVTNLGNERYWTNIVPGGLNGYSGSGTASANLGTPRLVQASIQVDL